MSVIRKLLFGLTAALAVMIVVGAGWLWQVAGAYGFNTVLRRGGTYWITVKPDDERLSASMQLALKNPVPAVQPGSLVVAMGPRQYDAKAGAFIADAASSDIRDLTHQDWGSAFAGATNAMVSYPLLIGDDGQTHVNVKSRWLANRTFVAKDGSGRIVIGTTKEAFFSLDRLAEFLKASPLDLKVALNLDGGPIACRSVRLNGYSQKFYARWEAQVEDDNVKLLRWPILQAAWAMPMVLTVERR
ncbi:phosphodiester glycosidase family protein [Rhizobium hidalgonense]|uniref:Phosphodiester glycosidase domain-containing protein n=1 Tax=Rhizobium hidalgonense TaxID=1538159 RepID=A0ABX4JNF8_9HYPH|nr:phosphodiester glycosidase family protein [Rhizobium hidalgonense]MDR9812834.1 phosphodiester glycosidase family protein [Rhizobium hidalgonense]MDR9821685.1 phosphodiester glycosidase family protein [Rhizobium hidalgonense]PDT21594.1 hypothetical protein CO674_21935 [Rhizobium hidalgonense]PON08247.1 hypothetical protein ATY29_07605 [Rhizobium hidalgonense]